MQQHIAKHKDRFDRISDWSISRAEAALADLVSMANRLYNEGYSSGAEALDRRQDEFWQMRLQFDGNITCLDMNGNCTFHHDERLLGKDLGKYKDITGRYVFRNLSTTGKGFRNWIDDFDPEAFNRHESIEGYIGAGKGQPVRANYAIYTFFEPWKWFLIIEVHSKLADIRSDEKSRRRNLKVFLCHSSFDKPVVQKLYKRLIKEGFAVWLDEAKLIGGQDWETEIKKAVKASHVVLVCLSKSSVSKVGFIQKEIRYALDVALEHPDEDIYIIPLRLEECVVPERLSRWQWIEFYKPKGYEKLVKALDVREEQMH
ncbi:MAG TPA: TIR domain-containing protein [Anaerolineales bacterium]|nr:TIR domain-containing protein [Anaerolineales bacterium]